MLRLSATRTIQHLFLIASLGTAVSVPAQNVDVAAAEKLLESSKCGKCHSVDKQKDGPSYKKTAARYKGKADGESKLYKHMTTSPTIEIDGVKEEHTKIKSSDEAAVGNVARYILSR
jgi:cytochrome c